MALILAFQVPKDIYIYSKNTYILLKHNVYIILSVMCLFYFIL